MINEDFGYSHKQKKVWNWLSKNFRRATKFLPGFGENGSGNCEYGLTQIDGYGNEIQTVSADKVKERLQVMCKGWFPDRNDRDEFVDVMVDTFCNKGYGLSKYGTVMKLKEGKDLDSIIRRVIMEEVDSTIQDGGKYDRWKSIFDSFLSEMVNEIQTDYLNQLGLTVKINQNYVFSGGKCRWLAAYERRSQQILNGIISIGINYSKLYSEMCKRRIDKDKFNIEAQARITIGHEIGHGLVDYIKSLDLDKSLLTEMPNVSIVKKCGVSKEENLVEEFGECQFPDATGCYDSVICDALEEINNISNDIELVPRD